MIDVALIVTCAVGDDGRRGVVNYGAEKLLIASAVGHRRGYITMVVMVLSALGACVVSEWQKS